MGGYYLPVLLAQAWQSPFTLTEEKQHLSAEKVKKESAQFCLSVNGDAGNTHIEWLSHLV